jgi:hypothetical protein
VWWSTKERGFYWASLALGLVLVLAAQRIVTGRRPLVDGALFGLAAGLGFWESPTVVYFALPAALWLLVRRHPPWRWLLTAVPASVLGALPWLVHNVGHGMPSLDRPPQPEHVGYVDALGRLLWRTLPMALGLRYPISERWLLGPVTPVLYVALGVALAVAALRRSDRPVLPLLAIGTFVVVYAALPGAWFVGEGRYALFASPFLVLLVAWLVRRPAAVLVLAAASAPLSFVMVRPMGSEGPPHIGVDIAAMQRAGVQEAWADYWLAYRLDFESDGRITASSSRASRDRSLYRAVARSKRPAFVYARGDARAALVANALPGARRVQTAHFDVVIADGPVPLVSLPPAFVP